MIIKGSVPSNSINLGNVSNVKFQTISNGIRYSAAKQGDSVEISQSGKMMYANMKGRLGDGQPSFVIEIEKAPREIIDDALGLQKPLQHTFTEHYYEMKRIENGDGDRARLNLLSGIKNDLIKMEKNAHQYYKEHGALDDLSNEELSQGVSTIEYKDIALIKDINKELDKIHKGQFTSDLEYYDAVLEKLYDSKLSDKAKKSIGGYVEHLKKESTKEVKLNVEDTLSVKEIERELERIKEKMNKDNTETDWKKILDLNEKLSDIYLNYFDFTFREWL